MKFQTKVRDDEDVRGLAERQPQFGDEPNIDESPYRFNSHGKTEEIFEV